MRPSFDCEVSFSSFLSLTSLPSLRWRVRDTRGLPTAWDRAGFARRGEGDLLSPIGAAFELFVAATVVDATRRTWGDLGPASLAKDVVPSRGAGTAPSLDVAPSRGVDVVLGGEKNLATEGGSGPVLRGNGSFAG